LGCNDSFCIEWGFELDLSFNWRYLLLFYYKRDRARGGGDGKNGDCLNEQYKISIAIPNEL
jgi:hypothetical protein